LLPEYELPKQPINTHIVGVRIGSVLETCRGFQIIIISACRSGVVFEALQAGYGRGMYYLRGEQAYWQNHEMEQCLSKGILKLTEYW